MTDLLFDEDDEANTPLTAEQREQLIPSYITLRRELNEAEQINIAEASRWLSSRRRDMLDLAFLSNLHRRMFGEVWRWAGQYRQTPRNIGIDAYRIPTEMRQLIDDVQYCNRRRAILDSERNLRPGRNCHEIQPSARGYPSFPERERPLLALGKR